MLSLLRVASRYSAGALASILWSAGVKDKSEVGQVISGLEAAGMPTLDISNMEAARVRARTSSGQQDPCLLASRFQPTKDSAVHAGGAWARLLVAGTIFTCIAGSEVSIKVLWPHC